MHYLEEVVYNGRDNAIALALLSDDVAITHNSLSRCQVLVGSTLIDSSTAPAMFDLTQSDSLQLKFGAAGLSVGRYSATLIVFDATHTNGLVWGGITIVVK